MDLDGTERHDRHARRRALLIVASLVPFIATMSFLWFRSTGAEPASDQGATDIARIVCRAGTTMVETPVVHAQIDGVHLLVESDVQGLQFSLNDNGWKLGWKDSVYPFPTTQWLPPGVVEAQCGTSTGVTDGVAFEVIDPEGLWHEGLACFESGDFDQRASSWFYADVNPMLEAIARAIPGVRASDVIDYYGYPQPPEEQASTSYRMVRDGRVVGSTEIVGYDDRRFASVYSCNDSGIGVQGEPTAGQLATPFELPGLPRCDPYTTSCTSVYLTAARYADIRGQDPDRYAVPDAPWAACQDTQPEGCRPNPDDVVLRVLLAPPEADLFMSDRGCGSSEATACR